MTEWQPIETAPRDGTEFLAISCYWSAPSLATYWVTLWSGDKFECAQSGVGLSIEELTHWMPLPEPPK